MRKTGAALLIVMAGLMSGCFKRELPQEEQALLTSLRSELNITQVNLGEARDKEASLSGGLLKSLVEVRIEVLETNSALLQQRINALESGAPIKQVIQVQTADPALAAQLAAEITTARAELANAQVEAISSSSMAGVMKAVVAATKEQTLAMLQQRYLAAKYGLSAPQPKTSGEVSVGASTQPSPETETVSSVAPGNGPFGLEAGLDKDTIEKMIGRKLVMNDETQGLYLLGLPPKPNDTFEQYAVVISPTVGLCQIRAIGKTISSNDYGHQLRSAFDALQGSLTTVYGEPKVYDALMPGSLWDESRDWMMALHKKDRTLQAEWNTSKAKPLKSDIENIFMIARGESNDRGYLSLQYSFSNHDVCEKEQELRSAGSL